MEIGAAIARCTGKLDEGLQAGMFEEMSCESVVLLSRDSRE